MPIEPRIPLNTSRKYYTIGFISDKVTHTFLTKYGYVYPPSEFENEGKYAYTLSCAMNDKINREIDDIKESILSLDLFKGYGFVHPMKERSVDDIPVFFINIKLRRDPKNPEKWMFAGELPDEEDDCILRIQPRVYVTSEKNEFGIYFELKAVEK